MMLLPREKIYFGEHQIFIFQPSAFLGFHCFGELVYFSQSADVKIAAGLFPQE